MKEIVYSYVASLVTYCPMTGVFRWRWRDGADPKSKRFNSLFAGRVIGTDDGTGYLRTIIEFEGKRTIQLHRLAWFIAHGELPPGEIDHKNGCRSDNRISNLGSVDRRGNCRNKSLSRNNTSGVSGVYWHKGVGKWRAMIGVDGKRKSLGYYGSKDEAKEVIQRARDLMGFSPRHGSPPQRTTAAGSPLREGEK